MGKKRGQPPNNGESISGYFRRIFVENPRLLWSRGNEELYTRWLVDHPEHIEVPMRIKQCLANVKSVLRMKGLKRTVSKVKDAKPADETRQEIGPIFTQGC